MLIFICNCRMWDVDDSGSINVTEMTNIIATMDDVEGVEQDPKVTQNKLLQVLQSILTLCLPAAGSIILKAQR